MAWVSQPVRQELEMIGKSYYPQSDFAREHYGRGLHEGERRLFRDLLQRRFGPLSEALETRVRSADREALLRWSDRMLTATRAEDVFAEP